jgi:hypothetical protein
MRRKERRRGNEEVMLPWPLYIKIVKQPKLGKVTRLKIMLLTREEI